MVKVKKNAKKTPLSRAQTRLLKDSLKKLLGFGLIHENDAKKKSELQVMLLKDALNVIELN